MGIGEQMRGGWCQQVAMIRIWCLLGLALSLCGQPQRGFRAVTDSLLRQFEKHDLVGLGEWHNTREDQELRIHLIRNPRFAETVRHIVVECGNAMHQETLDRYIGGGSVPKEEMQRVWRDTTQSPVGGGDSPACEEFLREVRAVNLRLKKGLQIRVLAGDPPIDWAKIKNAEEFQPFLRRRDEFAAELVAREVLGKKHKAVLLYGAGHLWRGASMQRVPNLAGLLDRVYPGRLFTVVRLGGSYPNTSRLEKLLPGSRPAFLAFQGTEAAELDANEFLGRGVPIRLFAAGVGIGRAADGCVYSGERADTVIALYPADPVYEKEKARRRGYMPQPRR